jgi:peptidoglycan/LPS O-acetylase OafA/YrhL
VAVALVIIHHSIKPPNSECWAELPLGQVGVDLFFGLSGFLITTRLIGERAASGRIDLARFYLRRSFRILPLAWVYLAVVSGLAVLGWLSISVAEVAGCLGFIRNYYPGGPSQWYTSHFWSLSLEEQFYLFFPLMLGWSGQRTARWLVPMLAVGSALARELGPWCNTGLGLGLPPGAFFYTRTHVRLDAIMWGCWVALLRHDHPRLLSKFPRWAGLASAVLLLSTAWLPGDGFWLRAALTPWMLATTAASSRDWLSAVLEWSPLRWLGRISFSLYVWQQLFFVEVVSRREASPTWLALLQSPPLHLLALVLVATSSFYFIERPLTRLGQRLARRDTPRARTVAPGCSPSANSISPTANLAPGEVELPRSATGVPGQDSP